jgi:hypothetical protein
MHLPGWSHVPNGQQQRSYRATQHKAAHQGRVCHSHLREPEKWKKMDSRTQRRTKDPHLCPVIQHGTQVQRFLHTVPLANSLTTINSTIAFKGKAGLITNTHILEILRTTSSSFGGKATCGFDLHQIRNKSICSSTVMALFINGISTAKIMIQGRWSSDPFLACCIRPQVLEWTNNVSREMMSVDSFFDTNMNRRTTPKDPTRTRANRCKTPFNGPAAVMPRLHLNHPTVQRHGNKPFQGKLFDLSKSLDNSKLPDASTIYILFPL